MPAVWILLYPMTQTCGGFGTLVGMINSCGSLCTFMQIDPCFFCFFLFLWVRILYRSSSYSPKKDILMVKKDILMVLKGHFDG